MEKLLTTNSSKISCCESVLSPLPVHGRTHACIKRARLCVYVRLLFSPEGAPPRHPYTYFFPPLIPLISPLCPYSLIKQTVALAAITPVFPLK